tara:strand:- start:2920 stop:3135 length:216 start_codon:yes stop_codon:yes gene_type:complete
MNKVLRKTMPYIVNNVSVEVELFEISKEKIFTTVCNMVEIPPPYCPICNKFLTNLTCNNLIRPKNCPLNNK